jgi:hypothetical protein
VTPEPRDPVDELLRRLAAADEPDPADYERARAEAKAALDAAIEEERRRRDTGPRFGWVAAAAATIVLAVGAIVVFTVGQPSPASAAIEEIAEALEAVPASSISDEEFLYTVIDSSSLVAVDSEILGDVEYPNEYLFYIQDRHEERWRGASGSIQIRETPGQPSFFDPETEEAYDLANLAELDGVGETTTQAFQDAPIEQWPADPGELDRAIRDAMVTNRGLPESVEYLDVALDILRDPLYQPEVRASTLHLVADLDGLELVETTDDEVTLSTEYVDRGVDTLQTFTIGSDGHLRFEEIQNLSADPEFGIPAGTVTHTATYSTPVIVDSLTEPSP